MGMTHVPEKEPRRYDDRGWTFFESCVLDGKGPSTIQAFNVITLDDDFDPDAEKETDVEFIHKFSHNKRMPIRTPEDFEQQLAERGIRTAKKGVNLFTSGKDQPFI